MRDLLERVAAGVRALLRGWGLFCPGKVMYIGGSDTLPAPLAREAEGELILRLEQGDEEARAVLIEHNLRLVVYIARRFENTGINIEDLISIGTIGLIKAVGTYQPAKSIKLATYASRCIENAILSPATFRGAGWGVGAFWSGFRPICTSFPGPRIHM